MNDICRWIAVVVKGDGLVRWWTSTGVVAPVKSGAGSIVTLTLPLVTLSELSSLYRR